MRNVRRPSQAWPVGGQLWGLQPLLVCRAAGSRMGSAVIPCSVWDRALWVLHEAQDPVAAHPKPRRQPGHLCTPRSGEKWGGPCLIQQQSLSINLGSQGRCQASEEWQMCPHPHQLHHLPPSLPVWPISLPTPAGRGSQTGLLPCRSDPLPSLPL